MGGVALAQVGSGGGGGDPMEWAKVLVLVALLTSAVVTQAGVTSVRTTPILPDSIKVYGVGGGGGSAAFHAYPCIPAGIWAWYDSSQPGYFWAPRAESGVQIGPSAASAPGTTPNVINVLSQRGQYPVPYQTGFGYHNRVIFRTSGINDSAPVDLLYYEDDITTGTKFGCFSHGDTFFVPVG